MKKIVFCNLTMQERITPLVYPTLDEALPTSDQAVVYPLNTYLAKTLTPNDQLTVVALVKQDPDGRYRANLQTFSAEVQWAAAQCGATATVECIDTEFTETARAHEHLFRRIVDFLEENATIVCDITYGSKAFPVVLYSALSFAEKFFHCDIEVILYGQVYFRGGVATDPQLRDLSGLYYLNSLTNLIECHTSHQAVEALDQFLSM